MLRTIEATIDENGNVNLDEPIAVKRSTRALVTILDDESTAELGLNEAAILSEAALTPGWSGPEEDAAWAHLADLPDIGADEPIQGGNR